MSSKLASITLLFCLITTAGFAQKNLKEALVIFNNADTTKGFIDYKEWLTSPSVILFTTDRNKGIERFTTTEVSYFEVINMERYQRHTVNVSLSNDDLSSIGDKDTSSETRTVFLKIVQQGKYVTLFSYRDKLKQRLYVLQQGEAIPRELLNSAYMFNGQVKEDKQFRSDLSTLVSKYASGDSRILSQISNTGYYVNDIADICRQINGDSKNPTANMNATGTKPAIRVYVGGGINQGALKISGNNQFSGITSSPFYSPLAVIGADLIFKPTVGRLGLRGEVHVTGYKTDAHVFKDFTQYTEDYFLRFKQLNIAFTPQLLYNIYNQKKIKWFVAAGIGLNFSSYTKNELYFTRRSSSNSDTTVNNYLQGLKSLWVNLCFSTGIEIHRMALSAAYFPSSSLTQTAAWGLDNTSLQVRLSYYIKK